MLRFCLLSYVLVALALSAFPKAEDEQAGGAPKDRKPLVAGNNVFPVDLNGCLSNSIFSPLSLPTALLTADDRSAQTAARLVLTNALCFKAAWKHPFPKTFLSCSLAWS